MAKIKVYRYGEADEPSFPEDYEVLKKAVLQVTDIKSNHNKYYAIELHQAGSKYRVFTHYGRTDDLETNPDAGVKQTRHGGMNEAEAEYASIYKQKTSSRKGYKELNLASSKIGSSKSRGQSSGHVDAETLSKINTETPKKKKTKTVKSAISPDIQSFVQYIYAEATNALTRTVQANITANGIETPLGVLTLGQIDKGQEILDELYKLFQNKKKSNDQMVGLSGDFYTVIPHRIGRTRAAAQQAVITTLEDFNQKQETLQLMRDMLSVSGKDAQVLVNPEVDKKYDALGCAIEMLRDDKFKEIKEYVEKSQIKRSNIKVKNVYSLCRPEEQKAFSTSLKNTRLLFHGSRAKNWVGILSRGLLLPKIVVSLGVNRTDAGWLGNGIYFGDAVCTTLYYTSAGRNRGTRMMAIANVALGKVKDYTKITYGLQGPPSGHHSCHGVRSKSGNYSQFADDEFVVYNHNQQKLEYLVEYTA